MYQTVINPRVNKVLMGGVICACIMALRYKYPSASIDAEEQGDKPDIP
jgi:hypothetical protein